MKQLVFKATLMATMCTSLICAKQALAYDYNRNLFGVGFAAPAINGSSNVPSPELGAIIYDNTAGVFKGYNGSSWVSFSATAGTAPTIQKFTSGTDATYTTPTSPAPLYIKIRMVGGGGGGAGSGTASQGSGGNGGDTIFKTSGGTALLTAGGGTGAAGTNVNGGAGGTNTIGAVSVYSQVPGGQGGAGGAYVGSADHARLPSGYGGNAPFFGGGGASTANGGSGAGIAGTNYTGGGGSGGGGGVFGSSGTNGSGGGSGGYIEAWISSPSSSYRYTVGSGGSTGGAGTSGQAGGAGGSGYIEVIEYYQ